MARYIASSLLVACGLVGMTGQAGAVVVGSALVGPLALQSDAIGRVPAALASPEATTCKVAAAVAPPRIASLGFAQASLPAQVGSLGLSKASAILGGAVSALDKMRMEQAGTAGAQAGPTLAVRPGEAVPTNVVAALGAGLTPGAGPFSAARSAPAPAAGGCNRFALPKAEIAIAPGRNSRFSPEDFLQTKRLAVSHTAFDRQWERVSGRGLSARFVMQEPALSRFGHGRATMAAVEAVNAWTNHRIRFTEDAKLYGVADYWAPAQTSLRLGAGDCEDIAIAKMQILAVMGVARSDMYLTIARDLARHADHALLVVRMDGRYWLLDNSTDRVLDANASYDYQPVLSFSEGHKWLHGAVLASAD